jgi:hypothetical protein
LSYWRPFAACGLSGGLSSQAASRITQIAVDYFRLILCSVCLRSEGEYFFMPALSFSGTPPLTFGSGTVVQIARLAALQPHEFASAAFLAMGVLSVGDSKLGVAAIIKPPAAAAIICYSTIFVTTPANPPYDRLHAQRNGPFFHRDRLLAEVDLTS